MVSGTALHHDICEIQGGTELMLQYHVNVNILQSYENMDIRSGRILTLISFSCIQKLKGALLLPEYLLIKSSKEPFYSLFTDKRLKVAICQLSIHWLGVRIPFSSNLQPRSLRGAPAHTRCGFRVARASLRVLSCCFSGPPPTCKQNPPPTNGTHYAHLSLPRAIENDQKWLCNYN